MKFMQSGSVLADFDDQCPVSPKLVPVSLNLV